jgi:hypothetical protein
LLFADPAREAERTAAVKVFVLDYERGANAILVTHARNIAALVGSALAQGEMVILKSDHDRVKVVGRLKAD